MDDDERVNEPYLNRLNRGLYYGRRDGTLTTPLRDDNGHYRLYGRGEVTVVYPKDDDCRYLYDEATLTLGGLRDNIAFSMGPCNGSCEHFSITKTGLHQLRGREDFIEGRLELIGKDCRLFYDYIHEEVVMDAYLLCVDVEEEDYDDFAAFFRRMVELLPNWSVEPWTLIREDLVVKPWTEWKWDVGAVVGFYTPQDLRRMDGPAEEDYIREVRKALGRMVDAFHAL